jgi:hypothetical protein
MNLKPILTKYFPENSLQGECGIWAHKIIDFPLIGNSYAQKKKSVQQNGVLYSNLYGNFRIGDVVITSEGTYLGFGSGHVCIVIDIDKEKLIIAESNFNRDGRVHYGRVVPKDKIYGVLRGKFNVNLGLPDVITLKTTILMQYEKQWDSSVFQKLQDRMLLMSNGKIKLDIYPIYTYKSLKNWWYQVYPFNGGEYSVIAFPYIQEQAIPITYGDSQIILWSINKSQWQGGVYNGGGDHPEYGWNYFGAKPIIATITCDEGDKSFHYTSDEAFIDYATHEISHGLTHWGRGDGFDNTDKYYWADNRSLIFDEIDYNHLCVNLF